MTENATPYFTIIARRWFDRKNGNTYHSCEVYRNGAFIGREPFAYGYDDGYRQTAHEILQNAGIMPKTGAMLPSGMDQDYHNFLMTIRDYEHWLFSVTDVTRKKDL